MFLNRENLYEVRMVQVYYILSIACVFRYIFNVLLNIIMIKKYQVFDYVEIVNLDI